MKSVLLVGLGRFGRHIAEELYKLNNRIMVVDKDETKVNSVLSIATNAQIGDSTDREFVSSLGIGNYDACIVAIGDNFQSSLETTSLLKELGAHRVISRASSEVHEKFLLRNGADEVIFPEKEFATWTALKCTSASVLDFIQIDGNYSIFEINVPSSWVNKSLIQLDLRKKYDINILGVKAHKNGPMDMHIDPAAPLQEGSSLYIVGNMKQLKKLLKI